MRYIIGNKSTYVPSNHTFFRLWHSRMSEDAFQYSDAPTDYDVISDVLHNSCGFPGN